MFGNSSELRKINANVFNLNRTDSWDFAENYLIKLETKPLVLVKFKNTENRVSIFLNFLLKLLKPMIISLLVSAGDRNAFWKTSYLWNYCWRFR